jgi:hypothetical protein
MKRMDEQIKPVKGGFEIRRKPCLVCGEPPFGDEYCCGHKPTDEGTYYRNLVTGLEAVVTIETEGPKRCYHRIKLREPGAYTVTWRPAYDEACRVASGFVDGREAR